MTIREVISVANRNECQIFVDGIRYEVATIVHGKSPTVELWENRDRFNDNEAAFHSFPVDSPVRIVGGCAVVTGEDGNDYTFELYQLAKFPILKERA